MADIPTYPGTPRWVKVFGIIAVLIVLLFVHRLFTTGGGHARHAPSHAPADHPASESAPAGHGSVGGEHR